MSSVDAAIKAVGIPAVIERDAGDVSTDLYIYPKAAGGHTFERNAMLPTTSGVVSGDLILAGGVYYLARSVLQDRRVSTFFVNRARLLVCNNVVTIRAYDDTSKAFIDAKTGVPCAIIDSSGAMALSDRGVVTPGFTGKDDTYRMFAQSSNGINRKSAFVDENSVSLSSNGEANPYFAEGLVEVPVKISS